MPRADRPPAQLRQDARKLFAPVRPSFERLEQLVALVKPGGLAQHRVQLERTPWVSGLDILPLVSMETKKRLMDECIEAGALVMFCHGPYPGVGRMTRTPEGFRKWVDVEPEGEGLDLHGHGHDHHH